MTTIFNEMLETSATSAQNTLRNAMVKWWMADDEADALQQIAAKPGQDLAGITNSVMAGLEVFASELQVTLEDLVSEAKLAALAAATPEMIVKAIDAIHLVWICDNFNSRRWGEKFFKGQLPQYRKTSKISWEEAKNDLLFISEYLKEGGNTVTEEELKKAFETYVAANAEDDDLQVIAEKARTFAPDIVAAIEGYRAKLDPEKKAAQIAEIDDFLSNHTDGGEIMEIMIAAVVK